MQIAVRLSAAVLPLLIFVVGAVAVAKKADIMDALAAGARSGLETVLRLLSVLCGLLCAVYMLRASGLLDGLARLLGPALEAVGIPGELSMLVLLRPLSGSGALAAGAEIMKTAGPDSLSGRMTAVMLASSETTLYTASVYLGAAGVKKSRYALAAAFAAEAAAFLASAVLVRLFWG